MSDDELNFKKMSTANYRLYRYLQSAPSISRFYKDMIKSTGDYRGAIIFPEQFLACMGNHIFKVAINATLNEAIGVSVNRVRHNELQARADIDKDLMKSFDQILKAEVAWASEGKEGYPFNLTYAENAAYASNKIEILPERSPGFATGSTYYWFSNKSDALSFARKKLVIA